MRATARIFSAIRIITENASIIPTDRPDIGYAMIFPDMTIVKILFVDIVAGAVMTCHGIELGRNEAIPDFSRLDLSRRAG